MLVHLHFTELLTGYLRAGRARVYLLAKWRSEVLQAYARRHGRYCRELEQFEARKRHYLRRTLPLIGLGLLALFFAGLWLVFRSAFFGGLLMVGSILLVLPALGYGLFLPGRPQPPENPLGQSKRGRYTSPIKKQLFRDLVPLWWLGLGAPILSYAEAERLAEQTHKWGLIGEYLLLRELSLAAGPGTLLLHSVMPRHKDDLDVVAIGPKGVWYFEVKYVRARFEWCQATWTIWQYDHEQRREVQLHMLEYPDAQWQRMRTEVFNILDPRGKIITDLKGGIVFAHAESSYRIQGRAPFRCGTVPEWIHIYKEAPVLGVMSPPVILHFTETLLKRHQDLSPGLELQSMNYVLSDLIGEEERKIKAWIAEANTPQLQTT